MKQYKDYLLKNFWLFSLTIIVFILIYFVIYIWILITGNPKVIDINEIKDYVTLITIFSGFISASALISLYSIFNSLIHKEKDDIIDFNQSELKKTRDLLEKDYFQMNKRIKNMKNIFELTTPYFEDRIKRQIIKEYKNIKYPKKELHDILNQYYDIVSNDPNEKNKKFVIELNDLLLSWQAIIIK